MIIDMPLEDISSFAMSISTIQKKINKYVRRTIEYTIATEEIHSRLIQNGNTSLVLRRDYSIAQSRLNDLHQTLRLLNILQEAKDYSGDVIPPQTYSEQS